MSRLIWGAVGEKQYETGIKNLVLYLVNAQGKYTPGIAWNGVTNVSENPSGAETTSLYADDAKYLNLLSAEELEGGIEAYMSPREFDACDGSAEIVKGVHIGQQDRKTFGICYKTTIANDTDGTSYGYKLHLVYGCTASPTERSYDTVNDSPEATPLSWSFKTTPVSVTGKKPTALVTINSTECDAAKLKALEDILYGTADTEPRMPLPDEIVALFTEG